MEAKLARLKDLITQREAIDTELGLMLGVEKRERAPQKCSKCSSTEHNARNCDAVPQNQL